jgi:type VI secretion system secreted protein Hcp
MASDIFLQIDGIKGESTDSEHKDWIEILSYSNAVVPPASATAKVEPAKQTGTAQHGDIVISKQVDSASPKLHEAVSSGKHISKATIEVMRASGDKRVKYMTVEMNQVLISSVSPQTTPHDKTAGGKASSDLPTESVSLNYGTIKWTYTQQKRADGSKGGNVAGGWDLSTGKA